MAIRKGKKVIFRKEDLALLDRMPSAVCDEAMILKSPRRGLRKRALRWGVTAIVLLSLFIGGVFLALENGFLDKTLTDRATTALDDALGSGVHASVGSTRLRFSGGQMFALEARDVLLVEPDSRRQILHADKIRLVMDPFALLGGIFSVSSVEIGNAELDAGLLGSGAAFDPTVLRIDALGDWQSRSFDILDAAAKSLVGANVSRFSLTSLSVALPEKIGEADRVVLRDGLFERVDDTSMKLTGNLHLAADQAELAISVALAGDKVIGADVDVTGLPLNAFLLKMSTLHPGPHSGLDARALVSLRSMRATEEKTASLEAFIKLAKGTYWADSLDQEITEADARLAYDYAKKSVVLVDGNLVLEASRIPLQGAAIDRDRMIDDGKAGYAIDLLINDGVVAPAGSGEAPLSFNGKAEGFFLHDTMTLNFNRIAVSTPMGDLAGSLGLTFGEGSPGISFSLRSSGIKSAVVKQFWPFWVAKEAREWVFQNLFAGDVTNGEVDVFIPQGVLIEGDPPHLNEKELSIKFDIDHTRFNFLGDIPPARNASGHFEMHGGTLAVNVPVGEIFLPSGQSVKIADATLSIDSVHIKPLMADIKLNASGPADAVAELSTFKPIEALQKTEFQPKDFTGSVTAAITARIGLVPHQDPPKPVWKAKLALDGVDIVSPVAGRTISGLAGALDIGQDGLVLKADASIDGAKFGLVIDQALDDPKGEHRKFSLSGTLGNDDIARFVPTLKPYLDGRVGVKIQADADGRQSIETDLGAARLTLPWVNWKKGAGVAAKASFKAQSGQNGLTRITDFVLKGEGFGAEGEISADKAGLVNAKFSKVQLGPSDRLQMSIKRTDSGLAIDVKGSAADVRPVIASMKDNGGNGGDSKDSLRLNLTLDKATGYNKESLTDLKIKLAASAGRMTSLSLTGVTASGQAIVASKDIGQKLIEATSGDAGAMARFADVYRNMRGGLLNVKLRADSGDSWSGSLDVRNFALINEARLKSIVSTPTGKDGRSLNDAVRNEIDAGSQKFQRAFARVVVDGQSIKIENGVVRGEQVGATFQGTARDSKGNMDMTGTFMPAYGINRLFGELPIIGALLGNGRDRGLLGITFKLAGPVDNPKLSVNPLSLIAPGVFRSIFEFE